VRGTLSRDGPSRMHGQSPCPLSQSNQRPTSAEVATPSLATTATPEEWCAMRWIELALMGLPAAVVLAWLMGLRHASMRLILLFAVLVAALAATLFWMGDTRSIAGRYVPAHLQNGHIEPGHGQ
jgi:hypothetical protein